jgi:hypothetical protein
VLAVERGEPPADVQPQPEHRRKLRIGEVGIEVSGQIENGLLKHIRGVDPRAQPRIEAELHHARQPITVLFEERRERALAAVAELSAWITGVAARMVHKWLHTRNPRVRPEPRPKKWGQSRAARRRDRASGRRRGSRARGPSRAADRVL